MSGTPGALWLGINGHITRGGDFERRKLFVEKHVLPSSDTFGATQVNGQLFVFGSAASVVVPAGVTYQRLQHPGAAVMTGVLNTTTFGGKIYAVAQFDDGNIYHYYDGARVTSWDAISESVADNNAVAAALGALIDTAAEVSASPVSSVITITAAVPGTAFTISSEVANNGPINDQTLTLLETQVNVAAVTEVQAIAQIAVDAGTSSAGVNKLSSITIDGVEVLNVAVDWATSNTATAAAIAAQVQAFASTPEYTAASDGNVVTISAASGTGTTPNSYAVTTTVGGDVVVSAPSTMSGGVAAVSAVSQVHTATVGGTFEAADTFTIIINGIPYVTAGGAAGIGITSLTFNQKVYSVTNSLLYFSALSSPTQFGSGIGSGFINMQNQDAENEDLVGVRQYQNRMAIFSRNSIQIWNIDVDPALNSYQQTVENSGSFSNKSILPYGNIDVFYLNDSGVRSLRARDSSNAPSVNDVGVAIDTFLIEFMDTLTDAQKNAAVAVIGPDTRYWLAIEKRIFVFSFFPGSKINAWTYYDLSDELTENISELVKVRNRVYVRSGDSLFLYGGDSNTVYPAAGEAVGEASLPFLSADKAADRKGITGFDIGARGVWDVKLLADPADETTELPIGVFTQPTFNRPAMAFQTPAALFSLKCTCSEAGYAKLTTVAVHFQTQNAR